MSIFLEKYRLYIGSFLVVAILAGTGVLLWQKQNLSKAENNQSSAQDSELISIKKENEDLQNKLKELEDKISGLEDEKKNVVSGKVAGASISALSDTSDSSNSSKTISNYSQPTSAKTNINTASTSELEELPGVGPTRAQQIITYRTENGGFKTIEEIKNIKGIGEKTYEKMKEMITVD